MSLELENVIHTSEEAFEALKRVTALNGRPLRFDVTKKKIDLKRQELCIRLCDALIDLLSACFGVDGSELRSPMRCKKEVARIRQVGMYVAHTSIGMTMTDVAAGFARDRTTVMHACHRVEDLRDDIEFDAIVVIFERIANSAFKVWRMAA